MLAMKKKIDQKYLRVVLVLFDSQLLQNQNHLYIEIALICNQKMIFKTNNDLKIYETLKIGSKKMYLCRY